MGNVPPSALLGLHPPSSSIPLSHDSSSLASDACDAALPPSAAHGHGIRRARHASVAVDPAADAILAGRDETPQHDAIDASGAASVWRQTFKRATAVTGDEEQAVTGWDAVYDYHVKATLFVNQETKQITYQHPAARQLASDRNHNAHSAAALPPLGELAALASATSASSHVAHSSKTAKAVSLVEAGMVREIHDTLNASYVGCSPWSISEEEKQEEKHMEMDEQGGERTSDQTKRNSSEDSYGPASDGPSSPFLRFLDRQSGVSMHRILDRSTRGIMRLVHPDSIRSPSDLSKARKATAAAASAELARIWEKTDDVLSSAIIPWPAGEAARISTALTDMANILAPILQNSEGNGNMSTGRRSKQLLQRPVATELLTLLSSMPSGMLGACVPGHLDPESSSVMSSLWTELEHAAHVLTLHSDELEMLVRIPLMMARKAASCYDMLRCIGIWNQARVTYGATSTMPTEPSISRGESSIQLGGGVRIPNLIDDLTDFSFEIIKYATRLVDEVCSRSETTKHDCSSSSPSPPSAHQLRQRFEAMIRSRSELQLWRPMKHDDSDGSNSMGMTLNTVQSVVLAHLGLLAETHLWLGHHSAATAPTSSPTNMPLMAPYVLDVRPQVLAQLITDMQATLHTRQNERINWMLHQQNLSRSMEQQKTTRMSDGQSETTSSLRGALAFMTSSASPASAPIPPSSFPAVTNALSTLFSSHCTRRPDHIQSVKHLIQLLSDILSSPQDDSLRRIDLNHPSFTQHIRSNTDEVINILRVVGFESESSAAADDHIMVLPASKVDTTLLRYVVDQLNMKVRELTAAHDTVEEMMGDGDGAHREERSSSTHGSGQRSRAGSRTTDPLPPWPQLLSPLHPAASQADMLHWLSLLRLFFQAATEHHVSSRALSMDKKSGQLVQLSDGSHIWKGLVDMLLAMLEAADASIHSTASASTTAHGAAVTPPTLLADMARCERERVISILLTTLPLAPPCQSLRILMASLRHDLLRARVAEAMSANPELISLLPHQSRQDGPFRSVWERLAEAAAVAAQRKTSSTSTTPDPKQAMQLLSNDAQLVHMLLALSDHGQLSLLALSNALTWCSSPPGSLTSPPPTRSSLLLAAMLRAEPRMRKIVEAMVRAPSGNSAHGAAALSACSAEAWVSSYVTHNGSRDQTMAEHNAMVTGRQSPDSGSVRSPTSSPAMMPLNATQTSLFTTPAHIDRTVSGSSSSPTGLTQTLPSLSLGAAHADEPHGREDVNVSMSVRTSLQSYSSSASAATPAMLSPLRTPAPVLTSLTSPRAGAVSPSPSPMLSPQFSPTSPFFSASPLPDSWAATSTSGLTELSPECEANAAEEAPEWTQYSTLIDSMFTALRDPEIVSNAASVSVEALRHVQCQLAAMLHHLFELWMARTFTPLTGADIQLTPQLLQMWLNAAIKHATQMIQKEPQRQGSSNESKGNTTGESSMNKACLLRTPLFALLPSALLSYASLLQQLPLTADPHLLDDLSTFYTAIDGFDELDSERSSGPSPLSKHISPRSHSHQAGAKPRLSYNQLLNAIMPTDPVIEFVRAEVPTGANKPTSQLIRVLETDKDTQPETAAAMESAIQLASAVAGATSSGNTHSNNNMLPRTTLPLSTVSIHPLVQTAIEKHVFGVDMSSTRRTGSMWPVRQRRHLAELRLSYPSLFCCPQCGEMTPDHITLFDHMVDDTNDANRHVSGLCRDAAACWSLLRHSTSWLIGASSRSLACAGAPVASTSDQLHAAANVTATLNACGGSTMMMSGMVGDAATIQDSLDLCIHAATSETRASADSSSQVPPTRWGTAPRTIAQWLQSPLFAGGLELLYMPQTILSLEEKMTGEALQPLTLDPTSPILAASAADMDTSSSFTLSLEPTPSKPAESLTVPFEDKAMDAQPRALRSLASTPTLNKEMATGQQHEARGRMETQDERRETDASLRTPQKETGQAADKQKQDGADQVSLETFRTPATEASPVAVTVGHAQIGSATSSLLTAPDSAFKTPQRSRPGKLALERRADEVSHASPTAPTPTSTLSLTHHAHANETFVPSPSVSDGDQDSDEEMVAISAPNSPQPEPFPYARFLSALLYSAGMVTPPPETGVNTTTPSPDQLALALDARIMSHASMRMASAQRRRIGESGVAASRAILAALLKHTGHVRLAMEYARETCGGNGSTAIPLASKPVPAPLLRLWKHSNDILSDMVSIRQSALKQVCVHVGCDLPTVEQHGSMTDGAASYKCADGHVEDDCRMVDSSPYAMLAGQIQASAALLIRLRPACEAVRAVPSKTRGEGSQRLRRLLRTKPLDVPFSPMMLDASPLPVPSPIASSHMSPTDASWLTTSDGGSSSGLLTSPTSLRTTTSGSLATWSPAHTPLTPSPIPLTNTSDLPRQSKGRGGDITLSHATRPMTWADNPPGPLRIQIANVEQPAGTMTVGLSVMPSLSPAASDSSSSSSSLRVPLPSPDPARRARTRRRWALLRAEMLAARMPWLVKLAKARKRRGGDAAAEESSIASMVVAFCREMRPMHTDGNHKNGHRKSQQLEAPHLGHPYTIVRAHALDLLLRRQSILASQRVRGCSSIARLIQQCHGEHKVAAISHWITTARTWAHGAQKTECSQPPSSASAAAAALANALRPSPSPFTHVSHPTMFLLGSGVGGGVRMALLQSTDQVLDAIMDIASHTLQQLGIEQHSSGGYEHPINMYSAHRTIADVRKQQTTNDGSSISPTASLSLLHHAVSALFSFCVEVTARTNTTIPSAPTSILLILPLVQHLMFHFASLQREPAVGASTDDNGEMYGDSENGICLAVGKKSRAMFRLMLLSTLSPSMRHRQQSGDASSAMGTEANESPETEQQAEPDTPLIRSSTAAGQLLHALLSQLERLIPLLLQSHAGTSEASPTASPSMQDEGGSGTSSSSSFHPQAQAEQDCFDALSLLLMVCSSLPVRLTLTHQEGGTNETEGQSVVNGAHELDFSSESTCRSLSTRAYNLLSHLLHPSALRFLSLRCFRRGVALCRALLPLATPRLIEIMWNENEEMQEVGEEEGEQGQDQEAGSEQNENAMDLTSSRATTPQPEPTAASAAEVESEDNGPSAEMRQLLSQATAASSQLITYLLKSIGYYACGRLMEASRADSRPFPHSRLRGQTVVSELISLVRHLHGCHAWTLAVDASLSLALYELENAAHFLQPQELDRFYLAHAAVLVYGGWAEPMRVGARVKLLATPARAEKMSERHAYTDANANNMEQTYSGYGTVLSHSAITALVVRESDGRSQVYPCCSLQPVSHAPALPCMHIFGAQGRARLRSVVRFINRAFQFTSSQTHSSQSATQTSDKEKDSNSAFSLFPPESNLPPSPSAASLFCYAYSQLHVACMRALLCTMTLALTRPERIADSVRVYAEARTRAAHVARDTRHGAVTTQEHQPHAMEESTSLKIETQRSHMEEETMINGPDVLLQVIVKESNNSQSALASASSSSSSASKTSLPLLSNLLAVAQQIIPLCSVVGRLDELSTVMSAVDAAMNQHAAELETQPERVINALKLASASAARCEKVSGSGAAVQPLHIDLISRALQLHPSSPTSAILWARSLHQSHIDRLLGAQNREMARRYEEARPIIAAATGDMAAGAPDIDLSMVSRALMPHNGDTNAAIKWLKEHGLNDMATYKRNATSSMASASMASNDFWGLEGVDFYQEKGCWKPVIALKAEEEELKAFVKRHPPNPSSQPNIAKNEASATSSSSDVSFQLTPGSTGTPLAPNLPHVPPLFDPYRRLLLSAVPQMCDRAMHAERIHEQLSGRAGMGGQAWCLKDGWMVRPRDVRPDSGQRLRINPLRIARFLYARRNHAKKKSHSRSYRWYFLTDDNHWAPLDDRDMQLLDAAYDAGLACMWIGTDTQAPSLVRIDKMCMYNEITGHARPLRRKIKYMQGEREEMEEEEKSDEAEEETEWAIKALSEEKPPSSSSASASSSSAASSSSVSAPNPASPPSASLLSTFTPTQLSQVSSLASLGFSSEHCALALVSTRFTSVDAAAEWLLDPVNESKWDEHRAKVEAAETMEQARMEEEKIRKKKEEAEAKAKAEAETRMKVEKVRAAQAAAQEEARAAGILLPLTPTDDGSVSKKQKLFHHPITSLSVSPRHAVPASVRMMDVSGRAGQIGTVVSVHHIDDDARMHDDDDDANAQQPTSLRDLVRTKVLLRFEDEEDGSLNDIWIPLAYLDLDVESMRSTLPVYAALANLQFNTSTNGNARKITHNMQQQIWSRQRAWMSGTAMQTEVQQSTSTTSVNTLFNLAVDVNSSVFITYARRLSLICLYLLSLPQPGRPLSSPTSSPPLSSPRGLGSGGLELVSNFSASCCMRIIKLAALEPNAQLTLDDGVDEEHATGAGTQTGTEAGQCGYGSGIEPDAIPSTPGLRPRNDLMFDWTRIYIEAAEKTRANLQGTTDNDDDDDDRSATPPPTPLPSHPRVIDVWLMLSTFLHATRPSPVLSVPAREQLLAHLISECKRGLAVSSYFVRDIDTEHPYQSGVSEGAQKVEIEGADAIMVTFDRRCNISQSHAMLCFYADATCREPIVIFSGSSPDDFTHIVIAGDRFWYSFMSGRLRQKPYEFGFRFRVRPLSFRLDQGNVLMAAGKSGAASLGSGETCVFSSITPPMAHVVNAGTMSNQKAAHVLAQAGLPTPASTHNVTTIQPNHMTRTNVSDPLFSASFSLGWPLLLLLTDSPTLIDQLLSHPLALDLIQSLLRYLTVCRSPNKVLACRALTSLCVRMPTPLAGGMFEILLRVMEQLYDSNTQSGWGSSPFLMALVELIRQRPISFRLSDSDVWSVQSIDGRPASWFFLAVLRAESLSRSLLTSTRLPHQRVMERALNECGDLDILRWCLKQPELCLKLHKQVKGWNQQRREWMMAINQMQTPQQIQQALKTIKDSLLPECFAISTWLPGGLASQQWDARLAQAQTLAQAASLYLELEASLKWGDSYPEVERAFGDTWGSRRGDWLTAMRGLANSVTVPVASVKDAMDYRWTRFMDEALVRHMDEMTAKSSRRLMSMTFRDIMPLEAPPIDAPADHPARVLQHVPIEHIRARFALLKLLSNEYSRVLPVVDLSFVRPPWTNAGLPTGATGAGSAPGCLATIARRTSKTLLFHQSKMYLWRSLLGRLYSEERPQFVILNRHAAVRSRNAQTLAQAMRHGNMPSSSASYPSPLISVLRHSLFYQLFSHIHPSCDPSALRRRGQAWQVKFVGEGGHDVGGMYNESLVEICNELQSVLAKLNNTTTHETEQKGPNGSGDSEAEQADAAPSPAIPVLPLFRPVPNYYHVIGENRNKYLPSPEAGRLALLRCMLYFVGRLLGVCCLDNNRALPLDLPPLIWKVMVGEPINTLDLKAIDFHTWKLIHMLKHGKGGEADGTVTRETFPYLFPDLTFTVEIDTDSDDGDGEHHVILEEDAAEVPGSSSSSSSTVGSKRVIELIPGGRNIPVTYDSSPTYATLLERFYLRRYDAQISILVRGMAGIIPFEFLSIFRPFELETMVCGSPDISISLLRDKTEYRGNVRPADPHVNMFWEVLKEMSQEQRKNFLQFVWGRTRLPSTSLGFGKDFFKLSDHAAAQASGKHDQYLPVAHTCFFALELPRYSSKRVLSEKLLYAISQCQSIDSDATHEGRANMMMRWEDED